MARFVFSNFAVSTLSESIGVSDTTIDINVDDVLRFPTLVGGAKFPILLADSDDNVEIMYVSSLSMDGTAIVERGQEGTQAQSWLAGTLVQHTFTAATVIAAAGFRPRGDWSAAVQYDPGDVVEHTQISWVAVTSNLNSAPSLANANWMAIYQPPGAASTAMNWQNRYSPSTTYSAGQVVEHNGDIWQSNVDSNLASAPAVGNANWTHIAHWAGAAKHETVLAFAGTNNYTATIAADEAPLALYDGMTIWGRFANTNTANATLAINSLPAVPLRLTAGVNIPSGGIIAGELYGWTYISGTNELIAIRSPDVTRRLNSIESLLNDNVFPIGIILDYAVEATPPGGRWLLCNGQAVSRTTYAALFALIATTYGAGDGSTTFNLPDLRGRVTAGTDTLGTTAAGRLTGFTIGFAAGVQSRVMTLAEMPTHSHVVNDPSHTHGVADPSHAHNYQDVQPLYSSSFGLGGLQASNASSDIGRATSGATTGISILGAFTGISLQNAGSNSPHTLVQPTMALAKIIRVL